MKTIAGTRVRRYLKYAAGEVTLIVVGIIIAVQINGWNETRLDRGREHEYLVRLHEEARTNIEYFAASLSQFEHARSAIDRFARELNNGEDVDSLIASAYEYFTFGALIPIYAPKMTTFEDLSSTGNLNLIKDVVLRDEVIELYGKFSQFKTMHSINRDWTLDADGRLAGVYGSLKWDSRTKHLYPTNDHDAEASQIRTHLDVLLDHASVHYWTVDRVLEFYMESTERTQALLDRITAILSQE